MSVGAGEDYRLLSERLSGFESAFEKLAL